MLKRKQTTLAALLLLAGILAACATGTESPTVQMTEPAPTATESEPEPTESQPTATEPAPTATSVPATATPMPTLGEEELISMGEQLYVDNCAACHQEGGEGTGAYPVLDGNPFVTQDPERPIRQVINGQGTMPGFGNSLSNEEIAAIVSYIRNAWTNDTSVVTPDQVQQARE